MSDKQFKVGNVVLEIPESHGNTLERQKTREDLIAGRGNEAQPIASGPSIPNPNQILGSSAFLSTAIGKVGKSDKKWINNTGILIFFILPLLFIEALVLWAWVAKGKWIGFVILNSLLLITFPYKKREQKK